MSEVIEGTVKKFNDEKGFGFITLPGEEKDVFVHYTAITAQEGGRRTLFEGQKVKFTIKDTQKGPQAENLTIL